MPLLGAAGTYEKKTNNPKNNIPAQTRIRLDPSLTTITFKKKRANYAIRTLLHQINNTFEEIIENAKGN